MPGLMMLSQQLNVYAANLSDLSGTVNEKVNATQREASREFTPIIVAAMEAAYKFCTQEQGAYTGLIFFLVLVILPLLGQSINCV